MQGATPVKRMSTGKENDDLIMTFRSNRSLAAVIMLKSELGCSISFSPDAAEARCVLRTQTEQLVAFLLQSPAWDGLTSFATNSQAHFKLCRTEMPVLLIPW